MIEVNTNTTLKIDKTIEEEIIINKNVDLELDIIKYLNLNLTITLEKNIKSNIYLITNHNIKMDLTINVNDNSSVKVFFGLFNKKNNTNININLIGKNSNTNYSMINLSNHNISTHSALINHLNDNTNSIITNRSILNNNSICSMNIKSNIKNDSINSNSSQNIEAIILDSNSKVEMSPILFIDENNVYAKHSSSVSRINERDLYYLMSKGINKETANKIYALNFLLKDTPNEKREIIEKMIERYI